MFNKEMAMLFPLCNIGDMAFLSSGIYTFCNKIGQKHIDIITPNKHFYSHSKNDTHVVPVNNLSIEIISRCNLINKVIIIESEKIHKKYLENYSYYFHEMPPIEWIPNIIEGKKLFYFDKIEINTNNNVIFQPISLDKKPKEHREKYIQTWNNSIELLLDNKYNIYMIGSETNYQEMLDSSIIEQNLLKHIINKMGKWTVLEALSAMMYNADLVMSCDSWAGAFGILFRIPTCFSLGYRMENGIDTWLLDFLSNRDIYVQGWSSKKEETDILFSEWIEKIL